MAATAPPALLPPYIPSPAFSSSFQTSALLLSVDNTPVASPSPSSDYFGDACLTPQTAPRPTTPRKSSVATTSTTHAFFGRLRSSSLHSSHLPSPALSFAAPPTMPSGPTTPTSITASSRYEDLKSSVGSSTSTAPSSITQSPGEAPYIQSVSIPHHSGSGKHCVYACRVVPDLSVSTSPSEVPHSRRGSLGKMKMAGTGEPHTVWRSWQECLDFSTTLSAAYPDNRPESPSSVATFPSSRHKVPRLHHSKKLANLFKSSNLGERRLALEAFFAQLFQMPPSVRHSSLVREFFRIRPQDAHSLDRLAVESSPSLVQSETSTEATASAPAWLTAGDPANDLDLTDATIKAPRRRATRPALAIKTSSPDLRGTVRCFGDDALGAPSPLAWRSPLASDFLRPPVSSGASTLAQSRLDGSPSLTPTPSSRTITPTAGSPGLETGSAGLAKTLRKKASGGLRHIRSLGDLRGSGKKAAALETPIEPVPSLSPAALAAAVSSIAMNRAATQPLPDSRPEVPTAPLSASYGRPSEDAGTTQGRHRRSGSSKSSSSFEELWGTSHPTAFRQTPSGRLECVRDPQPGPRRPSLSASAVRPPGLQHQVPTRPPMPRHGHTLSSASISSVDSVRSGSSGSARSLAISLSRSSGGSEMCPTPPTPLTEWGSTPGENGSERMAAGKFYVENGVLHENNMVPPPPFFPVPPPMTFAYSHEGLPHTPRSSASSVRATHARKSSMEQQYPRTPRSRTGSMASSRRMTLQRHGSLDPILASPPPSSAASSPRLAGGCRTAWTFKLLHADENIVLRVSKPLDGSSVPLERLRSDIQAKFRACGVALPGAGEQGEWGLAWTARESGVASGTKLLIRQDDLDACLRAHDDATRGKIVLKIIC